MIMETIAESDNTSDSVNKDKKSELPVNLHKTCLVCGDKALGYNFNAISCESCKAFFRRNALASKEFKCPFTNSCEITVVTRRFCQKCRLEKCLSIGMIKEFIMSEEGKAEKRKKIEENRAKKRHRDSPDETVSSMKSIKRDDENSYQGGTNFNQCVPEPAIIQYDVLNSTTCSPTSTVHSPLYNDVDASVHSSTTYNHYVPIQNDYHQYTQWHHPKKPIQLPPLDERAVFTPRASNEYNVADSMDAMYDCSSQKAIGSIKSILTNSDTPSLVIKENKPLHICEDLPSTSNNPNVNKAKEVLQDVERIEPNSIESILCEAIKLEFEAYTSVKSCSGSSRELNEVERAKLNELIVANKALHAPIDDDLSQLIGAASYAPGLKNGNGEHHPELITIVNLTAIAIRRLIKMAKKINAFKNMCEEDQVALLKGGCIEMMVLRSTMTYDGQRNSWNLPHSQEQFGIINTDVLKLAKGNIYQAHESFISSFDQRWRGDENIILIMSSILLFTPDRPNVVHNDVIKLEQLRERFSGGDHGVDNIVDEGSGEISCWLQAAQDGEKWKFIVKCADYVAQNYEPGLLFSIPNSYYYLLRRYLESVYPGCEAKSTFLKLIQKILELRKLAEEVTGVYLDVNPIEPLLMEIFDLKQHAT